MHTPLTAHTTAEKCVFWMDVTGLIRSGRAKSCSESSTWWTCLEKRTNTDAHTTPIWILKCMRLDMKIDTYTHRGTKGWHTHCQDIYKFDTPKATEEIFNFLSNCGFNFNYHYLTIEYCLCVCLCKWMRKREEEREKESERDLLWRF